MGAGIKSRTLRELDAEGLREALEEKEVTPDNFPELSFWKILEDYVNQGYGCSGNILIPKIQRVLRFQLCVWESGESAAMLQHWDGCFSSKNCGPLNNGAEHDR